MDLEFDNRLKKIFDNAASRKLWKGTPAARDRVEYWAVGVEAYFDAAGTGHVPHDADYPIAARETLKTYDAELFALVEETFAYRQHADWRIKGR